jgi:hypothetical protein
MKAQHDNKFNADWLSEIKPFPQAGKGNDGNPTHGEYIGGKKKRPPRPEAVKAEAESSKFCVLREYLKTVKELDRTIAKRKAEIRALERELELNPDEDIPERIHSLKRKEKGDKGGLEFDLKISQTEIQKVKKARILEQKREFQARDMKVRRDYLDAYHRAENDRAKLQQTEQNGELVETLAGLFGGAIVPTAIPTDESQDE